MIRNTWPVGSAGDSRTSRTCGRRQHVLSSGGDGDSGGGGGSLLRIVALTLCCVMATCGDGTKDRTPRGIKDLQLAMNMKSLGDCDLEPTCDWRWNRTRGFVMMRAPARSKFGPTTDANNTVNGKERLLGTCCKVDVERDVARAEVTSSSRTG